MDDFEAMRSSTDMYCTTPFGGLFVGAKDGFIMMADPVLYLMVRIITTTN